MGTEQTNFAICDCLITCLEARPVADSKTSLIMFHGGRFKSLLKGFTALKMHLIFRLLLDRINYTQSAFCIFFNERTFGQFGGYLVRGKDLSPVAPSPLHSSFTCPLAAVSSGNNFFLLLASGCCRWTIGTPIALWLHGEFRAGSRKQELCLGHGFDHRRDQKSTISEGILHLISLQSQLTASCYSPPLLLCVLGRKERWKRSRSPQAK